jgi:hypothetical protein
LLHLLSPLGVVPTCLIHWLAVLVRLLAVLARLLAVLARLLAVLVRLLAVLIRLLTVLVRFPGEVLASTGQRFRSVDVDLDAALDVLDADDLVTDRAERGKDEIDVPEEHGVIP